MKKRFCFLVACVGVILLLNACDRGNEWIKIEIAKYPNKMIYQVDVDSCLDLSGGKVKMKTRGGYEEIFDMDEEKSALGVSHFQITHDVDFGKEGTYNIRVSRHVTLYCEFAIEVAE